MDRPHLAVLGVGGNALTLATDEGGIDEQLAHAQGVGTAVVGLLERGWRLLLTHGNGPQVGLGMRRARLARATDPSLPAERLDECVAETQGSIAYALMTAIGDAMLAANQHEKITSVVTRVLVSIEDPAFANPTKPIDLGAHRDLVPSPKPLRVLDLEAVGTLLDAGHIVVAGGGGGIPVVHDAMARYRGVAAVIDKDYTSALLATELDADLLVSCTSVQRVAIGFGTPAQRDLDELDIAKAERLLRSGEFPPGSMGPKIESALRFLREAGAHERTVVITTPELLSDALAGRAGTRMTATQRAHLREA